MSGPKDYRVTRSASRLLADQMRRSQQAQRREETARRRAQENSRKLAQETAKRAAQLAELSRLQTAAKIRRNAEVAASITRVTQRSKNDGRQVEDELQRLAEVNRQKLLASQRESQANLRSSSGAAASEALDLNVTSPPSSVTPVQSVTALDKDVRLADEESLRKLVEETLTWKSELEQDQDVVDFHSVEAKQWDTQCRSLLDSKNELDIEQFELQARNLIDQAKEIHANAGQTACKFESRNELVSDIIASLKEVGFVVADPRFSDPQNPSADVLLVATKGSERVEASINLNDEVQSTWDNVTEEHCKTSFFDYVDAMAAKGMTVSPDREDLRTRPITKQQGAKDLPNSKQKHS